MDKIKNLLTQASLIQKKYDELAEYSGEHYNVFNILGVRSDELSHSAILTNLLDARGSHGQKDLFLKLFIQTIKSAFEQSEQKTTLLADFRTGNSRAEKEKFAGKVNYEAEQGGRIDIIINDGLHNIIIENKIYAGDQPLQLIRYNEYDKKAPLLYLTLDGKEVSDSSKGPLQCGHDYICISYQSEIAAWLENCIKEMTNKPMIRETLNQYLFLVKSLTNQSNHNKMNNDIYTILLNDKQSFESFTTLMNARTGIKSEILSKKLPSLLHTISASHSLKLLWNQGQLCSNTTPQYSDFYFANAELDSYNLNFNFQFQGKDHKDLIFGFSYIDMNKKHPLYTKIRKDFNTAFGVSKSSDAWLCYKNYDDYTNWNDLNILEKINFGEFEMDLLQKMSLLAEILSVAKES